MTFARARLQLTFWYLLIVMLISLMFSTLVYLVSFREINIFNARQSNELQQIKSPARVEPLEFDLQIFEQHRQQQLDDLKNRMVDNLILTNLAILVLAGLASYSFASHTLRPIEEMVDRQNRFTADASHEFRTPLTAMRLETEVALRDKKFSLNDAKKLLKSNLEESQKLETLSNGLLELAQYSDFKQRQMNFKIVSIKESIGSVIKRFLAVAQKKQIKISSQIANLRSKINSDQLEKLVAILLDNAIKYSPVKTTIKVIAKLEHKFLVISVQDQGIGINQEDAKHIFDRFYRGDLSRHKVKGEGFGLGLAIAQEIVSANGGNIKVESVLNKGTIFIVRLPQN